MNPILAPFADNEPLFNAVKEELLAEFRLPLETTTSNDVELGQKYRALITGAVIVDKVFRRIERLKTKPLAGKSSMPGR